MFEYWKALPLISDIMRDMNNEAIALIPTQLPNRLSLHVSKFRHKIKDNFKGSKAGQGKNAAQKVTKIKSIAVEIISFSMENEIGS